MKREDRYVEMLQEIAGGLFGGAAAAAVGRILYDERFDGEPECGKNVLGSICRLRAKHSCSCEFTSQLDEFRKGAW